MSNRSFNHPVRHFLYLFLCAATLLVTGTTTNAQVIIRPALGLQTMTFVGDAAVNQPIAPGPDREDQYGGGILGPQNGIRLQLEASSGENAVIRFPLSIEYYFLSGKTSFSLSSSSMVRKQRLTFTHTANIASIGAGLMVSPIKNPTIYLLAEAKGNYVFPTTLEARISYPDKDETIQYNKVEPFPGVFRIGGYARIGAQLEFFEPLLLDFSIGYGALNIFSKDTDPVTQHNLLIIDNQAHEPEGTIGYIGLNMSLIWKL